MKIAKLKLPHRLKEPYSGYGIGFDEIDTFGVSQNTKDLLSPVFDEDIGYPHGVVCYEARPHDDTHFGGHFLLLVIKGQSHWMADAEHYVTEFSAERGTLIIVNADVLHWLFSSCQRRSLWMALCWDFPLTNSEDFLESKLHKERLVAFSASLVKHFNGTWTPWEMGLYGHWFQEQTS